MSQQQYTVQISILEIVKALRCKKCRASVKALVTAKLKEQRDKEIEKAADKLVGGTE
jgi:hypothetical protein